MTRKNKFAIGRRWFCDRSVVGEPPFWFVIVGPDPSNPKAPRKMCRLEYEDKRSLMGRMLNQTEQVYSHAHLRRYAVLEDSE